ncbi:hypothetical protein G6F70_006143 [Rhizopus microsporus]|nr:hypothetical protein G6F71_005999 [Rhizopus microsporus]KAG1198039.1 hypothetical protein G6F70_006143 [Rhizopus microsporus]KAG1209782.1 hypothetical protein G6F69_006055 [Rhizopus microsporus]KAG1231439.1 hypothetical protein G6F67_005751 [Rhizopus microsporus]KAG1263748.1 hypothetical protein G6F68_004901 [Rhizopus microsporus]
MVIAASMAPYIHIPIPGPILHLDHLTLVCIYIGCILVDYFICCCTSIPYHKYKLWLATFHILMPILVAPLAKGWTTSYIAVPWLIASAGVYVAEKYKRTLTLTAWFKTAFIECMATNPQGDQIRRRGVQRLLRILLGLAICRYMITPLLPEVPQILFQYPWYSIPGVYYTFLMGFKGYLLMNASTVSLSVIQTTCGIDLLEPFDKPFLATSPKDFWSRRWNSIVRNLFIKHLYTANDRGVNKRLYVFYFSASMHEIIMTIVNRQMTDLVSVGQATTAFGNGADLALFLPYWKAISYAFSSV